MNNTSKIVLTCALIFCVHEMASAQSGWVRQNSGLIAPVYRISVVSSSSAWASCQNGTMLHTTDSGLNWVAHSIVPDITLYGNYFLNDSLGWAFGFHLDNYTLYIYKTTNSGQNWSIQYSSTQNIYVREVFFISGQTGWACGGNTTSSGIVISTTNSGSNWNPQIISGGTSLNSIHFISPSVGWTVGRGGRIFSTTNAGSNWTPNSTPTGENLYSVYFISTSTGWAAGERGTLLRTANGGANWVNLSLPVTLAIFSVQFVNANTGWAAGEYGRIFHTTDGGSSWVQQPSGTKIFLEHIRFISPTTGWAVGEFGTILKTTTGGF